MSKPQDQIVDLCLDVWMSYVLLRRNAGVAKSQFVLLEIHDACFTC